MKNYFLLFLLLFRTGIAFTQTITIKDGETEKPLVGVTLISEYPKAASVTNAQGQTGIFPFMGSERIQIRSVGYKTMTISYDDIKEADYEIFMEPLNIALDEVVISATRWRQVASDVPSKIISISSGEAALQNPQTTADLLGISGKVFIQKSQQGGGSPMIRGFATNRLIYTVDGIRMNTAIFRGGNLQNVINLDPFAIENTEVLFGPGSVIYGSDAIGGVMSFQTLKPQFSMTDKPLVTGKALTRYSSANSEKTGHFDVSIGWKKWALVTSFSSWDFGNLRQGNYGPDDYLKDYYVQRQDSTDVVIHQDNPLLQVPSAYLQTNLMQKIRFKPGETWDFEYEFHYSATSPYGRYDRHNRMRNGLPRYAEWDYGPQKWMMNNLKVNYRAKNTFFDQASLRLAIQQFEESRIDRALNDDKRNTQVEKVDAYSVNLDLVKATGSRNTLFYGIEFILDDVTSNGTLTDISTGYDQTGSSRYPQSTWSSLAAYINDEYRVSDNFTFQAGMRYNQFILNADFTNNLSFYPFPFTDAEINNGALTGSIGGVYHPSGDWVVKGSFGTAFRSPNVDDIGKVFDSEPGSVTVPNPDLDAEYAWNFDLGISKVFDDRVKLDITGYYTILKNALVRRDFRLNGQDSIFYDGILSQVQAVQNAAQANVYGVQGSIEVKLPAGFRFTSDLSYQSGEEELDDGSTSPSRHAAPLFGTSRISYKADKLNLQFYSIYQAEKSYEDLAVEERGKDEIYARDSNGNNYSPAWYTLNVKVMYELTEVLKVTAGVENLTDQRYRPYSSGISGSGRNFFFALQAVF